MAIASVLEPPAKKTWCSDMEKKKTSCAACLKRNVYVTVIEEF